MEAEVIFRISAVVTGVFLLVLAFISLVKKKMTEGIALGWAVGSVLLILIGVIPCLSDWTSKVSITHVIALILFAAFVVGYVFKLSSTISQLTMKTQELAMQVSLLNQENERILNELEELTGKKKVDI